MSKADFGRYGVKITLTDDSDSGLKSEVLIEVMVDYIGLDGVEQIAEAEEPESSFDDKDLSAAADTNSNGNFNPEDFNAQTSGTSDSQEKGKPVEVLRYNEPVAVADPIIP